MIAKLKRLPRYDWPLHFSLLLTNWLPDNTIFLWLRGALASRFLGTCGRDLRLGRNLTFYNPSKIHLGDNIYIAYGCWFMAGDTISVDDGAIFGPYCVIVSSNHSRLGNSFRYGSPQIAPIVIGAGTWLASHVVVTAGSHIGSGTLVAASAVVVGNLPDSVLAAGQAAATRPGTLRLTPNTAAL